MFFIEIKNRCLQSFFFGTFQICLKLTNSLNLNFNNTNNINSDENNNLLKYSQTKSQLSEYVEDLDVIQYK